MSQIQPYDVDRILERFKQFLEERLKLGKPLEPKHPIISSPSTIKIYYFVAKRFLKNMSIKYAMPFDSNVAREYFSIYRKRGAKPRTLLLLYSVLKNLYYCMGWNFDVELREVIPEGIDIFVEEPYLTEDEVSKVLEFAERMAVATGRYRDLVLIYLLAYGMRPGDIRRLKIANLEKRMMKDEESNLEYEAYVIKYVPCKRGRNRVVILDLKASMWMERWVSQLEDNYYRILSKVKREVGEDTFREMFLQLPLFPRFVTGKKLIKKIVEDPQPISYMQIYFLVRHYVSRALGRTEEAYKKAYPYAFRRGLVTRLLEDHQPYEVERWIGWKTPGMSRIYDKRTQEEIAKKFIIRVI